MFEWFAKKVASKILEIQEEQLTNKFYNRENLPLSRECSLDVDSFKIIVDNKPEIIKVSELIFNSREAQNKFGVNTICKVDYNYKFLNIMNNIFNIDYSLASNYKQNLILIKDNKKIGEMNGCFCLHQFDKLENINKIFEYYFNSDYYMLYS